MVAEMHFQYGGRGHSPKNAGFPKKPEKGRKQVLP
jgi:hypothetical protein